MHSTEYMQPGPENFPDTSPFHIEWYKAVGITKLACYNTYRKFRDAAIAKYGDKLSIKIIPDETIDAMCEAAGKFRRKIFRAFHCSRRARRAAQAST